MLLGTYTVKEVSHGSAVNDLRSVLTQELIFGLDLDDITTQHHEKMTQERIFVLANALPANS